MKIFWHRFDFDSYATPHQTVFYVRHGEAFDFNAYLERTGLKREDFMESSVRRVSELTTRIRPNEILFVGHLEVPERRIGT